MPAVLGFVVFVRRFDRIVGPSPPETARFVDKVSSSFQVEEANFLQSHDVLEIPTDERVNLGDCGHRDVQDVRHHG